MVPYIVSTPALAASSSSGAEMHWPSFPAATAGQLG